MHLIIYCSYCIILTEQKEIFIGVCSEVSKKIRFLQLAQTGDVQITDGSDILPAAKIISRCRKKQLKSPDRLELRTEI